jgi:hypothetical protein
MRQVLPFSKPFLSHYRCLPARPLWTFYIIRNQLPILWHLSKQDALGAHCRVGIERLRFSAHLWVQEVGEFLLAMIERSWSLERSEYPGHLEIIRIPRVVSFSEDHTCVFSSTLLVWPGTNPCCHCHFFFFFFFFFLHQFVVVEKFLLVRYKTGFLNSCPLVEEWAFGYVLSSNTWQEEWVVFSAAETLANTKTEWVWPPRNGISQFWYTSASSEPHFASSLPAIKHHPRTCVFDISGV